MCIYLHVCVSICICVLRRNFRIVFIQKTTSLDECNKASWIKFSFSEKSHLTDPTYIKVRVAGTYCLEEIEQNFLEPDKVLPSLHLLICRVSICGKGGQICIKVLEPPGRKKS